MDLLLDVNAGHIKLAASVVRGGRERPKTPDIKAPDPSPAQKTASTSAPQSKRLDPGVAPIVTKRWRDLPPESLLSFYAQAIRELGDPVLFSLHFTKDVHEKMRKAKEKPRDFIAKRMRRHLKGVPFYFVIELPRLEAELSPMCR